MRIWYYRRVKILVSGRLSYELSDKTRKAKLSAWLDRVVCEGFEGRILEIGIDVMRVWGEMYAKLPRSLPIQDTLIAATAMANNLTIATRNVKDFKDIAGLSIFNPWDIDPESLDRMKK